MHILYCFSCAYFLSEQYFIKIWSQSISTCTKIAAWKTWVIIGGPQMCFYSNNNGNALCFTDNKLFSSLISISPLGKFRIEVSLVPCILFSKNEGLSLLVGLIVVSLIYLVTLFYRMDPRARFMEERSMLIAFERSVVRIHLDPYIFSVVY